MFSEPGNPRVRLGCDSHPGPSGIGVPLRVAPQKSGNSAQSEASVPAHAAPRLHSEKRPRRPRFARRPSIPQAVVEHSSNAGQNLTCLGHVHIPVSVEPPTRTPCSQLSVPSAEAGPFHGPEPPMPAKLPWLPPAIPASQLSSSLVKMWAGAAADLTVGKQP